MKIRMDMVPLNSVGSSLIPEEPKETRRLEEGFLFWVYPEITIIGRSVLVNSPESIRGPYGGGCDTPDFIAEVAGRTCYQSFDNKAGRTTEEYIHSMIEKGHESVLEHATFTYYIQGVSRTLTHELVRHRVGVAYSQLSQRYVDESEVGFVVPPLFLENRSLYNLFLDDCEAYLYSYKYYLSTIAKIYPERPVKQVREAARALLPNCTETKLTFTANLRELRHIIRLRSSEGADAEIQRFAKELYRVTKRYTYSLEDLDVN